MNVFYLMRIINRKLPPYIWAWIAKYKNYEEQTGSGTLVFENTYGQKFSKFDVEGQTSQISTTGKNLLDASNLTALTSSGITFTPVYKNGTLQYINVNGTASANVAYGIVPESSRKSISAGTYTISGCPENGGSYTYKITIGITDVSEYYDTGNGKTITVANDNTYYIKLQIISGQVINNLKFYPMIELGSSKTDYEPYSGGYVSPSPNWEQPINNTTGDNTIKVENINIFDGEIELGNISVTTGELIDNTTRTRSKNYTKVKPNTTYRFMGTVTGGYRWIVGYNKNKTGITDGTEGGYVAAIYSSERTSFTFTTTATTEYIKWYYSYSTNVNEKILIKEGTTETPYIPHAEQTVLFPLSSGQYMAEGDYLADDGIHHKWGQVEFDGSEDEGWFTYADVRYAILMNNFISPSASVVANIKCNKLIVVAKNNLSASENAISGGDTNSDRFLVKINSLITSVSDFKTWLSNNPITVEYELLEETIEPYTETQQTAWNAIKELHTYLDYTQISQTNDGLSFILKVSVN